MKKTIVFSIILLVFAGLLASCGGGVPDIKDRVAENTDQELVYSGIIEPLEIDMYKEGTHQIRTDDDQLVIIQSQSVDLNRYLEKRVKIKGKLVMGTGGEYIFNVTEAEFEDSALSGEPQDFENKMYGFRFTYTGTWIITEGDSDVYFNSKDFKIVEIEIFENQNDLDAFAGSRETGEGTPVTIGAQRSLRYSDDSSIRVYVPNPPREKIFLITFNEGGEDIDAQKELFYDFLQTFQPIYTSSQKGEACGGKDNVKCAEGYFCELDSTEAEAEGVCVAVGERGKETDCPYISTPSDCRDYRVEEYAKTTGCPTRYECVNGESTDEESVDETTDTGALIGTIEKYQAQILGVEDATIIQYEITDSEDLIAIIYESEGKKFKTLYSYAPSANEFNFIEKAHFEQGDDRDWTLISGQDIQSSSGKTVIKAGEGNTGEPIKVSEDMRLYENEQKGFSMEYPENWYYRSFGTLNDTRWTVGFSDKPLDYLSDAKITLSIVSDGAQKSSGALYSVTRDGDEGSVFVIEGPEDMKETIDKMAESLLF